MQQVAPKVGGVCPGGVSTMWWVIVLHSNRCDIHYMCLPPQGPDALDNRWLLRAPAHTQAARTCSPLTLTMQPPIAMVGSSAKPKTRLESAGGATAGSW